MWLRSARFDLSWLILPLLAVLLLLPLDDAAPGVIAALGLGSLLLSGVHIASNWTLLFRDATFFRFDRMRYVHMGWLIMLGSVLFSMWDLSLFMSVYVYWGLWHFARQHWGIAMLYKAKAKERLPRADAFDKWMVHALLFLPLLVQFARPGTFGFYTIELYRFHLPGEWGFYASCLWWTLLGVWLIDCGWRFATGRLVVPFFLTALCSILSLACIYWLTDNFLLMYALISIPHSLQYIGLASHYHDGKNKRILKWAPSRNRRFFIGALMFTLAYTGIAVLLIRFNEQFHSPYVYGLLGLTIFHFWVELWSWRGKYNPELRQALGL
jgi:hypothetical protein